MTDDMVIEAIGKKVPQSTKPAAKKKAAAPKRVFITVAVLLVSYFILGWSYLNNFGWALGVDVARGRHGFGKHNPTTHFRP